MKKVAKKKKAVVITTEFRGVFFGYVTDDSKSPAKIELTDARCCIYWSQSTKGVLGLASDGPNKQCRIGKKVPSATIHKITGEFKCSDEAIKAWESEPWN